MGHKDDGIWLYSGIRKEASNVVADVTCFLAQCHFCFQQWIILEDQDILNTRSTYGPFDPQDQEWWSQRQVYLEQWSIKKEG